MFCKLPRICSRDFSYLSTALILMSPFSWPPTSAPSTVPFPDPFSIPVSNSKQISGNLNSRSSYQLIITANGAIYCLAACLAWLPVAVLHTPPEAELPCQPFLTYPYPSLPLLFSLLPASLKKSPKVNAQLDIFNTRQQKANCIPYFGVSRGEAERSRGQGKRALSQGVSW